MSKTTTKKKTSKRAAGMQEVKSLQEPQRKREHCGVPMKRMQNPSPSTGTLRTVWVCAKECGHQEMEPMPVEAKTTDTGGK